MKYETRDLSLLSRQNVPKVKGNYLGLCVRVTIYPLESGRTCFLFYVFFSVMVTVVRCAHMNLATRCEFILLTITLLLCCVQVVPITAVWYVSIAVNKLNKMGWKHGKWNGKGFARCCSTGKTGLPSDLRKKRKLLCSFHCEAKLRVPSKVVRACV